MDNVNLDEVDSYVGQEVNVRPVPSQRMRVEGLPSDAHSITTSMSSKCQAKEIVSAS